MLTIDDVPKWLIDRGISHILMSGGPTSIKRTPHTLQTGGRIASKPGKRICRQCVEMLKDLVPHR